MEQAKKRNQVAGGAILSYILIVFNAMYGLFITPYIVGCLGEGEYGIYKSISSLTSSLMVLDLGIGGTVMRYVAKFRAKKEEEKISNFVAMNMVQAFIMCAVVGIVSSGIYTTIDNVYATTFTVEQIAKAKCLFVFLIVNMLIHILENVINGVITGYNQFVFGNGIKVTRLIVRVGLVTVLLGIYSDALTIVLIDLSMTVLFLLVEVLFVVFRLKVHVKLTKWENSLFLESGKYTILMFLTSIAAQMNNNLDSVIIGAMVGPAQVTIYSFGLMIFGMFEQLSTSISGVMLPTVTNLLEKKEGIQQVVQLVIKVGRIQFMLLGAAFVGFLCIGQDFIQIWLGTGYEDVFIITLILMGPALFELCVNVCLSILRAKNMLTFRTLVLFGSTLLNGVVTVVAIKCWSYVAAALGTAVSFIVGSLIVMNIYYKRKLGLPMLRIYGQIMKGTWLCLIMAGIGLYLFSRSVPASVWTVAAGILIFVVIYGTTLILFGLTSEEKIKLKFWRKNKND